MEDLRGFGCQHSLKNQREVVICHDQIKFNVNQPRQAGPLKSRKSVRVRILKMLGRLKNRAQGKEIEYLDD